MRHNKNASSLIEKYQSLNAKERCLLRVIAVINLSLNIINIRAIIKEINATDTGFFTLPDGFSATIKDRWKKDGLVEDVLGARFFCSEALSFYLIREAVTRNEYNTIVPLRDQLPPHESNGLWIGDATLTQVDKMHLTDALVGNEKLKKRKLTRESRRLASNPFQLKYAAANDYVAKLLAVPFEKHFFLSLPSDSQEQAIESCVEIALFSDKRRLKAIETFLKQWIKHLGTPTGNTKLIGETASLTITSALIQWEWQYGSLGVSEKIFNRPLDQAFWQEAPHFPAPLLSHWRGRMLNAWHGHIRGKHQHAVNEYEQAYAQYSKSSSRKKPMQPPLYGLPALGYLLSLLALGQEAPEKKDQLHQLLNNSTAPIDELGNHPSSLSTRQVINSTENVRFYGWFIVLIRLQYIANETKIAFITEESPRLACLRIELSLQPLLAQWLTCIASIWASDSINSDEFECLIKSWTEQHTCSPIWLNSQIHALMTATVFKESLPLEKKFSQYAKSIESFPSLVELIQPKPTWQTALDNLMAISQPQWSESDDGKFSHNSRIIWSLTQKGGEYLLNPREQKRLKNGNWGKGRSISLHRLEKGDLSLPITSHDQKIIDCIDTNPDYYWRDEYRLDHRAALIAAIGHPSILWAIAPENADPMRPVDLVKKEVTLEVHEESDGFLLQLNFDIPDYLEKNTFIVKQDGNHRLLLVDITPQHADIARILGEKGLSIPKEAKEKVLESINSIAPLIPIESDLGGHNSQAVKIPSDSRLHIQVTPQSDGDVHFRVGVKPLGVYGQLFVAGEGRRHITGDINGKTHTTERNLSIELEHIQTLKNHCPDLYGGEIPSETLHSRKPGALTHWDNTAENRHHCKVSENEWRLPEEFALNTLLCLQKLHQEQPNAFELFWPKGRKFKINRPADISQMQLNVSVNQNWFSLEGELQLDENRVVSMNHLMALMENYSGHFIPLGNDEFITLTDQLRKRLHTLATQGTKQQYHSLALHYLEGVTEGMSLQGDGLWQEQKAKIQSAYESQPKLPCTLEASLRDYQQEGFEWMSRLSQWGGGACLADDMGLGKTLQCLTLILSRAKQGPTLVVAPTSVCMNWIREAARFTPTLNAVYFGDSERRVTLKNASEMDVVVCSYGLLTHEAELLQSVKWNTVVVDEAQALKNPMAKRSQVLFGLHADCKIAATGTPIENHLGELWSLFRFINPGLLGSREFFNQRFATPIQQYQDEDARDALRRLVQPFILRRLKNDVLTELPSRTEITRKITPSDEEQVFYEALRRQALNNLSKASDHEGKKRMQALAEIMKLRRSCCHPKLVLPNSEVSSSKLEAFAEIFAELKENNHRVLVFSQFVDHLAIIKDYLESQKVMFQYLDGSTSMKKRNEAVKAFQQGEGDAFLISLKAGGSGLNLTAADYVIHMDPWWNPAVEDQASDRAHRMGQTRPVTIYRLVTEGTIEEKILDLHQQKRDLADNLLKGSDMGGALSADQIIGLIEADI